MQNQMSCPCGTQKDYAKCCGIYLDTDQWPPSPEKLMRARYTAYTKQRFDYIQQTMQGEALALFDLLEAENMAHNTQWLELQVLSAEEGENEGIVEFLAIFEFKRHRQLMHEVSHFQKVEGKWYYVKGIVS